MSKPKIIGAPLSKDRIALASSLKNALADVLDGNGVSLSEDQLLIGYILTDALHQALDGNVKTIGIVACMENGFASAMGGPDAGALNLACDDLKRKILDAVLQGTAEKQSRRSSLIIPPMQ